MVASTDNQETGYIKLHRSILKWGWYDDKNTSRLFLHLLLTVNWEDKKWHTENIKAGEIITSLNSLKQQTKMTIQQIRTSLDKLKSTNEITYKTNNHYTIISITNWNKYQSINTQDNKPITNQQQTDNKPVTTTKEYKNIRIKEDSILSPIIPFSLDFIADDSFRELMQEFVEHRKAIKKPFKTQRGVEIIYNKLLKLSSQDYETARLIVDESIGGGYQGIFALNQSAVKKTGSKILSNGKMEGESTFDFNMRMTQERLKQFEREENNA